jgi:hypothetical protein
LAPDFLGEFASSVDKKKDTLKERILKGKPNPLQETFGKYFKANWIPIDNINQFSTNPSALDVMAIDSSVYTNPLMSGGLFYVIRSLAVCKDQVQKSLETDVIFTKASLLDAQRFVSIKMELLESKVALEALREGFGCKRILLDGSLYGRAVHLPLESKIEEQRLMMLDYVKTYRDFLDYCKENDILPIGVSKESRATFYRDYLLKLIFNEELKTLSAKLDSADIQKLRHLFTELLEYEEVARHKFSKIKQNYKSELDTVQLIFDELTSSRPDYQLIMSYAQMAGYTKPLLLGPSVTMAKVIEFCRNDPDRFVRKRFPISVREKGKAFIEYASGILSSLPTFPSIVSFHLLLDPRDSPIRIDLPYWDQAFEKIGWPKPIDMNIDELLKIMVTGYCGLDCHNIWLKNVDERVRLKKRTVDTIYFPLMEREFNAKIIRGRSYRRVRYT